MEEYFLSLKKFQENNQFIDIEKNYRELEYKNNQLNENNKELSKKIKDLENIILEKDSLIRNKDEEIASFTKSSLLSSMSKQIDELKNYISILEKQLKNFKNKQEVIPEKEVPNIIQDTIEVNLENNNNLDTNENQEEYETFDYNGKLFYKIKKRIYKINKDKTLGNLYGRLKNGELVKET